MFGKNEIVGKSYFKDNPDNPTGNKLYVTSVFATMQGEGPYRGRAAVFVRLAKCNLQCQFCDTFFDGGTWFTPEELLDLCKQRVIETLGGGVEANVPYYAAFWGYKEGFRGHDIGLVITGGEPLLQNSLSTFIREAQKLHFDFVQIESNGILDNSNINYDHVTLVVSPKCVEKNGVAVKYIKPNKDVLTKASCLKFVMEANPESPYSEIPEWAFEWRALYDKDIYVSPMNIYNDLPQKAKQLRAEGQNDIDIDTRSTTDEVISFWEPGLLNMEENKANHEYAARYAMKHGLVFQMQLHLFASLA